jgi:hypothetical protein
MDQVRPVELKLVDELFGMNSGYVLDFSNSTFADFFQREVGVDIYDEAYAIYGSSKGKHLRAFLTVSQPRAIAKALAALWEYRELSRIGAGQAEAVIRAHGRLTAIVERLGGHQLPIYEAQNTVPKHLQGADQKSFRADETTLAKLEESFLALHEMSDEPQARGLHFERLLADLFNAWGMDARGSFTLRGEQIDGSFLHGNFTYLLEAKWQRAKTDAATLRGFQGKVDERNEWTRGLFVSYSGFTDVGLETFTAKKIILADGMDVFDALSRRLSLPEIITAKIRHASEYRKPFERVRKLFPL